MRTFRARWLLAEDFVIGLWAPDESELWGGCGFHLREGGLEQKNAEIGMWIAGIGRREPGRADLADPRAFDENIGRRRRPGLGVEQPSAADDLEIVGCHDHA